VQQNYRRHSLLGVVVCAALASSVPAPLEASQVPRERVTLGALSDAADLVVMARVEHAGPTVELVVEDTLKGPTRATWSLPAGELSWSTGERCLLFLDRDGEELRAPATSWQKIVVDEHGDHLLEVVRGRLPQITFEPTGDPTADLRRALFEQLDSPLARVRADAALDLLAWRDLAPDTAELRLLRTALEGEPTEDLVRLAERTSSPLLIDALVQAMRGAADAPTRHAAGECLATLDPTSVLAAIADARPQVRRAALAGLAARGDLSPAGASAVRELAWRSSPEVTRWALATLAACADGAALREVSTDHPDPAVRELATRLRADPVALSRRLLAE
jgi:hypothetical protein